MTISDENKIIFVVAHPRIAGGNAIALNLEQGSGVTANDVNYMPYMRDPRPAGYAQGPLTLANDMMALEETWDLQAKARSSDEGGTPAFSGDLVTDDGESVEISIADTGGETLRFAESGYNNLIHFGATKIKYDEELEEHEVTLQDDTGTTLTQGEDYSIDPQRGMIELINENIDLVDDDDNAREFTIGYTFKNTGRNIAYTLNKIPKMGGPALFAFDFDSNYTGYEFGMEHTVYIDNVRQQFEPSRPEEAEVRMQMREAIPIDEFEAPNTGDDGGIVPFF